MHMFALPNNYLQLQKYKIKMKPHYVGAKNNSHKTKINFAL